MNEKGMNEFFFRVALLLLYFDHFEYIDFA